MELSLLAYRERYEELLAMVDRMYKEYPDDYVVMQLKYSFTLNITRSLASGNEILQRYLKRNYNDNVLTTIADNYFNLGNSSKALDLYEQRVENMPYGIGFYLDLSDLYFEEQNYKKALAWMEQALAFAPYYGHYWSKKAAIYEAMGDKDNARACYEKAIYYDPNSYDERKLLRQLNNQVDLFDLFEDHDIEKIHAESPDGSAYPEDNSLILLYDVQKIVYAEGASEERTQLMVKVFNQTGINNWKEYAMDYGYFNRLTIDEAEIIKPDGSIVQAETSGGYAVFTNLEVNDVIHLSYRNQNYRYGKLAQHFWFNFHLNYFVPALHIRYNLLVPAGKTFQHQVFHADIQPTVVETEGNLKRYTWETFNEPAVKSESYMPSLTDIGKMLVVSSLPDWDYVGEWYSDLASTKSKGDYVVKEVVRELFDGYHLETMSDYEKARMIYAYIEDNITYSDVAFLHSALVPQKAARTLTTKRGDCKDLSTLFLAMCREVGVDVNLVLIDTRDNGQQNLTLPSIDFNHCIALLHADGNKYYVELTDQKLAMANVPNLILEANALVIPRPGEQLEGDLQPLVTSNRPLNAIYRTTTLRFDNNDIAMQRHTKRTGAPSASARYYYADIGQEQQVKDMTESVAGDFTTPVKVTNLVFSDLKTLSDSISYSYDLHVKNQLTEVAGLKLFKLPWTDGVQSLDFISLEERTSPFELWQYERYEVLEETLTVTLPTGKVLAEVPKSVNISSSFATYSLKFSVNKNVITATRKITYPKSRIPVSDYSEMKEFFHKVAEADSKQYGFR
jgi:tetratricopeptide (TPR) repeat protein